MLPALAGMSPMSDFIDHMETDAPRTRGDEPRNHLAVGNDLGCSPHSRG